MPVPHDYKTSHAWSFNTHKYEGGQTQCLSDYKTEIEWFENYNLGFRWRQFDPNQKPTK